MNNFLQKFLKFSPPKNQSHLGVDISDCAIKVIELTSKNGSLIVTGCAIEPLPENVVVANDIKDSETAGKALLSAVQKANLSTDQAIIALPSPLVMTETIQVNKNLSDAEIEIEVLNDAARIVPYSLDDINMDFSVIGPTANNENTLDVLYIAARTEFIRQRISTLEIANLIPTAIDVEAYAMARSARQERDKFPEKGLDQVIAIVDIGATSTTLTVLKNFNVIFCREEIFGGKQLTLLIQEKYGLSFAEAGLAKKEGTLSQDYEEEILGKFRETLVTHIMRTLEYFFSSTSITKIDCLLLAGGVVGTPKLETSLQAVLTCPIFTANPFEQLKLAPGISAEFIKKNQTSLMLTVGLALWGLPYASN